MSNDHDARLTLARLPDFATIEPAELVDALAALLDRHRAELERLTAQPEDASFDSVVRPLEVMAEERHRFFSPVGHLHGVADSEALRGPYKDCVALLSAFGSELDQNTALYRCFATIRAAASFAALSTAEQRLVDNALRDFRLGGVDLEPGPQAEVRRLKVELSQEQARFEENLLDATEAYALEVDDESRLAGLPAGARALAAARARRDGRDGYTLTLDLPCYLPALTHLEDRELRKTLYCAYVTRASEIGPDGGRHDNSAVMRGIVERRQALAGLLGFDSYAELSLATKMAPSTAAVIDFLHELADRARPAAERELAELERFAAEQCGLDSLEAWDLAWCAEKLRKQRFELSQEELRPWFPAGHVIDGMLEVAAEVFGLAFRPQDGAAPTWHEDVRFIAIDDADGSPLGYFYLDLYARQGKRAGAWMDECLVRWGHDEGTQLPVAYLTCNFTPPVGDTPSQLTHDEVTTLFHEFGHGLHHLLTRIDRPAVAGINGVPWDAVELPSQFFENWCYEHDAVRRISRHVESGEPLPDAMFERIVAARQFHAAMQMLRQVEFALFDFRLHAEPDAAGDIQALLDEVRERVAVVKPPALNRFQHSFAHIFAGGYAAGYYSYKWAEVLAADAFARFEEEGVFNPDTGRAFRETVLERGGAEDAMALFKRFRGREPSVDALLRQAGLAA
ncbi:MAG: M3 family metallopeptidase [Gammaproteobacteria bacterium]